MANQDRKSPEKIGKKENSREQLEICQQWYDTYRGKMINPRTNRKIGRGKGVWNNLEKECSPYLRQLNKNVLSVSGKPEELTYPEINELLKDIKELVNSNWNNPKLYQRSTYNSKQNDDIPDLFSEKDIVEPNSDILVLPTKNEDGEKLSYLRKAIKSGPSPGEPDSNEAKNYDIDISDFGNTDAKKPLMDCATEFNTVNFIGDVDTRLKFIGLVIKCFTTYCQEIYRLVKTKPEKDGKRLKLNSETYNIMFKGGTTMRIIIKELVRDFTRDIENHVLDRIQKNIKLSDYDFEMLCNYDEVDEGLRVKLNVLTYLVILRLKSYLDDHKMYYFNFFQLRDEVKSIKLEELRQNMNSKVKEFGSTVTTIRGEVLPNFYQGINIDYVEVYNTDCATGDGVILNTYQGPKPDLSKYKSHEWYDWSQDQSYPEPRLNNCRTDFALIMDGGASHDEQGNPTEKTIKGVAIAFISAKSLLKKYGIRGKALDFCTAGKDKGKQLYATHNPLVSNTSKGLKFQLNRIKYSYTIYFTKGGIKYRDFIPGEILDLSCPFQSDRKSSKFIEGFNDNIYLQKFHFIDYKIGFYGYSIWGHITDIIPIIFIETKYQPWEDKKYSKRISRLLYLTIFYFFTSSFTQDNRTLLTYGKKLQLLEKLYQLQDSDFSSRGHFSIRPLEILRENLKEVTNYKASHPENYRNFKQVILAELKSLINILKAEYQLTRDPQLNIGPIDSGVLTITNTRLYGF